ncbi:Hypothetical predicted protein [Paramuricea clavata]|uniref:Uncharacterized protein n=1 Tax=Paramuricea clavata TaxID=317549 RepID=A0A7D9EBD8_PARCT|nr:Hypothetical predicted protein [Paramuricea clavata]
MPPRKQQRKRAATTTGGPSSRRSRRASTLNTTIATQNAAPAVDLPPLATPQTSTPPAPSSGNVLSPEILQTLVSTVAAEVTRQMATILPAQVSSPVPTPAVPAVPVMATEPTQNGKLPCPHRSCKSNSVKLFFEEKGIVQHFRTKHSGIVFYEEKQLRDAHRIFRFSHGEKTKQHLEILSKQRQLQSNDYERFSISTPYEACLAIDLVAECPKECAKLVGMLLMHYGQLRTYSEGAKPEILEVTKPGLCVKFNTWYSKRNVREPHYDSGGRGNFC